MAKYIIVWQNYSLIQFIHQCQYNREGVFGSHYESPYRLLVLSLYNKNRLSFLFRYSIQQNQSRSFFATSSSCRLNAEFQATLGSRPQLPTNQINEISISYQIFSLSEIR